MNIKHISVYFTDDERKMIREAAKITGLNQSAYLRTHALKETLKILRENKLEAQPTA